MVYREFSLSIKNRFHDQSTDSNDQISQQGRRPKYSKEEGKKTKRAREGKGRVVVSLTW